MRSTFLLLLVLCVLALAWFLAGQGSNQLPLPAAGAADPAPPASFAKEGVAFLTEHCVDCHGPKKPRADLAFHTYKDDAALLKDRKTWREVLRVLESGEMPPKGRPRPPQAEVEAFTRTVAAVFEKADSSAKHDPGRVTIRRLNRAEYNNTIRDLVGVDFQPAEDFPSDDVGHGFDNIGDVLSLSPVLLERYLAAAESIVQRAIIVGEPPPPAKRRLVAQFLRSSVFSVGRERERFRKLYVQGDFHTEYKLTGEGDYKFRFKGYGEQAGDQPVQITFQVDGKDIKTQDVKATDKAPAIYEVAIHLEEGPRTVAVRFNNPLPAGTDPKRGLFVQYFELEGPADTYPLSHKRLLAHRPEQDKAANTGEILTRFVSRAYRRPATKDEVERLVKLVEFAEKRGEKWEAGLRLAMQAVLVSPKFLFRVELDDTPPVANVPGSPHPISEYQLASRLSYFLWSTMPDDELFDLAGKGQLTRNLEAQVRRMLRDPKARALVDNFAMQWLQLRNLKNFQPDPKLFPNFDEPLRTSMLKETELFFESIIREDRSVLDLIDANYTFLDERLGRLYGIADTNGNKLYEKPSKPDGEPLSRREFQRVTLQGNVRGGILTQASILTVTSNPTRTSPVKRGRWVLDQLLGTPPPPPPPDVPELANNEKAVLSGSLRQRMEQHRADSSCAVCHARMDPIGFAFENFDAIGAYRTKDAGFPIDPSGTLPSGQSFNGPAELKVILKDKKDLFCQCLTGKLLTYALGRGIDYYDKPAIAAILDALAKNDYKFSTLAVEIARSEPFRLRRGKDGPK